MPSFGNSLNWNIRYRGDLEAETGDSFGLYRKPKAIPPLKVDVQSSLLAVGIASGSADPDWYLGGYVKCLFKFKPSSTSNFQNRIDNSNDQKEVRLGYLSLIDFTFWGVNNLELEIAFRPYLTAVYVEVWEYSEDPSGVYRPPRSDPYTAGEDLKAIRALLSQQELNVNIIP
jgi:hypothetical protein